MTIIDRELEAVVREATMPSGGSPSAFGRYEVFATIGSGSMGTVYAAEDRLIGRKVAIKRVRLDLADDQLHDAIRGRFRQEVRCAARCSHPGIVGILDFVDGDDEQYIVMEHVTGRSLQALMSDGRLTQPEALEVALQLLAALEHAHAQGVVHRDIKPANILVAEGSRIKLADFGVAWSETDAAPAAEAIFGTPSYMSPEQARGDVVDARSDLFSVGMLLLRMLTGKATYADASFASVLQRLAAPEPVDVNSLSAALQTVMMLATAKDAAHRFQTAGAFARALRELVPLSQSVVDLDTLLARSPSNGEQGAAASEATVTVSSRPAREGPSPDATQTLVVARSGETAVGSSSQAALRVLQPGIVDVLREHVGPIADTLSKRLAPACMTPKAFVDAVSLAIEHDATRGRFVAAVRSVVDPDAAAPAPATARRRPRMAWARDELASRSSQVAPTDHAASADRHAQIA